MKSPRPICLVGGHLAPAQSVAEYLQKDIPDVPLIYIARKTAVKESLPSEESEIMQPLARTYTISPPRAISLVTFVPFVFSFLHVLLIFFQTRPGVIVSFGSYVAVPCLLAAWLLRISCVVHDQTRAVSGVNKLAARLGAHVCVVDDQVKVPSFVKEKIITGFPLRRSVVEYTDHLSFSIPKGLPILLITGGTTGAVTMNAVLFPMISDFVKTHIVIHQTGKVSYHEAENLRKQLSSDVQDRYVCLPYISAPDMNWFYRYCSVSISRSGANTVTELAAFHVPSLFFPLPWSKEGEQDILAQQFCSQELGKIFHQDTVDPQEVIKTVHEYTSQANVPASGRVVVQEQLLQGTQRLAQIIYQIGSYESFRQ